MEKIDIAPTESSFQVLLDPEKNLIHIQGESRPENAPSFFDSIIKWLEAYKESFSRNKRTEVIEVHVNFNLDYFNSTSAKYLVDICLILSSISKIENASVNAEWHYKSIDEEIKESGEELSEMTGLHLRMIPFE